MELNGWHPDPFGIHEQRFFTRGQPMPMVRDAGVETYDPPPVGEPGVVVARHAPRRVRNPSLAELVGAVDAELDAELDAENRGARAYTGASRDGERGTGRHRKPGLVLLTLALCLIGAGGLVEVARVLAAGGAPAAVTHGASGSTVPAVTTTTANPFVRWYNSLPPSEKLSPFELELRSLPPATTLTSLELALESLPRAGAAAAAAPIVAVAATPAPHAPPSKGPFAAAVPSPSPRPLVPASTPAAASPAPPSAAAPTTSPPMTSPPTTSAPTTTAAPPTTVQPAPTTTTLPAPSPTWTVAPTTTTVPTTTSVPGATTTSVP